MIMELLKFVFKRKLPEHQADGDGNGNQTTHDPAEISAQKDRSANAPMGRTVLTDSDRQSQNSWFFPWSKRLKFYDGQFNSSRDHYNISNYYITNGSTNDGSTTSQFQTPHHGRQQENLHASRSSEQYDCNRINTHGRKNSAPQAPVVPPSSTTSRPTPNSQKSSEIYRQQLLFADQGFPSWIPEPSNTLPLEYQRAGVGIGDVIIFTKSGGVDFLFNVYYPKGDSERSINPSTMPEGYIPLNQPHHRDIDRHFQFKHNSFIASPLVNTRHDEESSALIFESSAREGAILVLPNGANSTDLKATMPLRNYARANAEQWYKYADEVCGRDVKNGDIHVVVGKTSTDIWAMAAIHNHSEEGKFYLKFTPTGNRNSGMVPPTYQYEYSGMAEVKSGPDSHEVEKLRGDDADGGDEQQDVYDNQCLFVRTINVTLQERLDVGPR